ncbi:MAG: glycosyltransferase family 9 protein [Gemmatimonadota bacterium]|nr:glycosyltransferase family 9 protein [Gemmatimonadota bacterium]
MAKGAGQRRKPERILVVSLDNLGDLVFASALVPPIRERLPSAHIAVWCKEYAAGLGPLLPEVDSVYHADPFWDRAPGSGKGSFREFLEVAGALRRARFDIAVLCFAPWRTAAAVAAVRIPVRIGLERRRNRRWLTHALSSEDRGKPVLVEAARLLGPLGIAASELKYRLDARRSDVELNDVRVSLGEGNYVALHAFAGSDSRCVALSEWVEIAGDLSQRGMSVLWIGTTVELDRTRQLAPQGANWRYSDALPGASLTKTALAISLSKLFIGHDSGPLHIASAFGVPAIGVFAPGELQRTCPQGTGRSRIIVRQSPRDISASDILAEVRAIGMIQ